MSADLVADTRLAQREVVVTGCTAWSPDPAVNFDEANRQLARIDLEPKDVVVLPELVGASIGRLATHSWVVGPPLEPEEWRRRVKRAP